MSFLIDFRLWRHSHNSKLHHFEELYASDRRITSISPERERGFYFLCMSWGSKDWNDAITTVLANLDVPFFR